MTFILDTSFLFALRERKDKYHLRALNIFKSLEGLDKINLITNIFIVGETYTLMNSKTQNNKAAIRDLDNLFWGEDNFFIINFFTFEEYFQISHILNKFSTSKKILSFADASIIYLSNILKCDSVISFDNHFDGILKRID
jgi:predicted nucleic acid-binding protein